MQYMIDKPGDSDSSFLSNASVHLIYESPIILASKWVFMKAKTAFLSGDVRTIYPAIFLKSPDFAER